MKTFLHYWFSIVLCGLCVMMFPQLAAAQVVDNNIFGMHSSVTTEQELTEIAQLVNSRGGSWGYVTVVIQETDRDTGKWRTLFNKMSELKLIPVVRLATQAEGSNWKRPTATDASSWVDFLDSLPWPTKDRYVVLFNEPNHG
jgi:hypothetical protein